MRLNRILNPLVVCSIWLVNPAFGVGGVLEINQTCAVETGCFTGDTAGFPVTIAAPGSYRLTSNLTVSDVDTSAISVAARRVGIHLNDFAILGPVFCFGVPTACIPAAGSSMSGGSGVESTYPATMVRNGSISGMGFAGVSLGNQAEVRALRVSSNRFDGITIDEAGTVTGGSAYCNGGAGISTLNGSSVSNSTAFLNGGDGVSAGAGSTISGNTSFGKGDDGIQGSTGCTVVGNTLRSNLGFGLRLGADAYRANTISGNVAGSVNGGVNMQSNSCNGTNACP